MHSVTAREERIDLEYEYAAGEIVGRTPKADSFRLIMERLRSSELIAALTPRGMTSEYTALKLRTDFCWIIISRHHQFRPNREIHYGGAPIPQSVLYPEQALIDDLVRLEVKTKFPDTFKLITDFLEVGSKTAHPPQPENPTLKPTNLAL